MDSEGVLMPEPETREVAPLVLPEVHDSGSRRGAGGPQAIPSFVERLQGLAESGMPLDHPSVPALIPESEAVSFLARHHVEGDRLASILGGSSSFEEEVRNGLMVRLWQSLKDMVPRRHSTDTRFRVPIAEIHRPHLDGCWSQYEHKASARDKLVFRVKARGVGAGGGVELTVTASSAVKATKGCATVTAPIDLKTVVYSVPAWGREIEIVTVTRVYADIGTAGFDDSASDPCSPDFTGIRAAVEALERDGYARRNTDFDEHPVHVEEIGLNHDVETSRVFLMGVPGVAEIESRFTETVRYSYHLVSDFLYLGYYADRDSAKYYWTWEPGEARKARSDPEARRLVRQGRIGRLRRRGPDSG